MSAHPLPSNDTSSSWWSSSPRVYSGYTYSPFSFDCTRSFFSAIAANPSYPSFSRSYAAELATYEDDFWWLNVLWCIFPILCPLLIFGLEMLDKKGRHWWRSQRSFQPPQWLNCLCVVQFIICNNLGVFVARYLLGRPIHSIHSYTFFGDFCQWLIFMPFVDTTTWFTHWLQHYFPVLYKYSHSTHHKVKFSTMWIVYYANPIDFLINSLWLYYVLFGLFDFHFYQTIILVFANTTHLTWTHSNYRDLSNGHHQIHHLEPRFNFCPGNPLIDKLFGTLMTVEEYSKVRDPEKMDGGDKDE